MRCDICGSTDTYVKDYEHNFTRKGNKINFVAKRRFCSNCNNLVYDSVLDNKAIKKAINIYNNKYEIIISNFKTNNTELSEFNGYRELDRDKIFNMILYFAEDGILKTKLVKEMFYADFINFKNTAVSITGLEYAKLNFGPVPDQYEMILNKGLEEGLIECEYKIDGEYEYYNIKAKKKYDKKIFNEEELKSLKKVKDKFKNFTSKEIVDYSHKEKAFLETNYYNKISYDYAFDINLK